MKKATTLLFTLMVVISSCSNDEIVTPKIIQDQSQLFPNQIGDQWTYRLSDDIRQVVDTVKVKIVGQGLLPNGDSAKIWTYSYQYGLKTYVDTVWVSYIDSIARIYDRPSSYDVTRMPYERLSYVFPLRVGNNWFTSVYYGDTTKILSEETVSVPTGIFTNVFQIAKVRGYVTNSWTKDTIYYKEHVGLIKLKQNEYSLGPMLGNGLWELISYNVH